MTLVTTEQAIAHVNEDSDANVVIYLEGAEQKAIDFLGRNVYPDAQALEAAVEAGIAGDRPMVVNAAIKAGILLIFGHLYKNREDVATGASVVAVKIPVGAEDFLWPHRTGLGV